LEKVIKKYKELWTTPPHEGVGVRWIMKVKNIADSIVDGKKEKF
jgi:hypothetical protein